MKLSDLTKDLGLKGDCASEMQIESVVNDSRKAGSDTLFVASSSYVEDAHPFVRDAYDRGCRVFVVGEQRRQELSGQFPDAHFFGTDRLSRTLAMLAKRWFGDPASKLKLIGITGTNGKTTTASTVYRILRSLGKNAGLIGTIEYRINDEVIPATNTTPDALALYELFARMAQAGVEYAVMEVSSHSLELDRVTGLEFDISAFTNLTQDHLDFHRTMENYFLAKMKLYDLMNASKKPQKVALINADIDSYDNICQYIKQYPNITARSYSIRNPKCDYYSKIVDLTPGTTRFELNGAPLEIEMIGEPNVYNFTTAAAILMECGFKLSEFSEAMKTIHIKGRVERVINNKGFEILIDYAHSPDAIENVLKTVRAVVHPGGRIITVFGAGGDRDKRKRPLMGKASASLSDIVIVTSDNPRTENPQAIIDDILPGVREVREDYMVEIDRSKAIELAVQSAKPRDIIVIAGKGHEDYQIVGKTKHHFSDREQSEKALSKL